MPFNQIRSYMKTLNTLRFVFQIVHSDRGTQGIDVEEFHDNGLLVKLIDDIPFYCEPWTSM